jgi:hypothetical protein
VESGSRSAGGHLKNIQTWRNKELTRRSLFDSNMAEIKRKKKTIMFNKLLIDLTEKILEDDSFRISSAEACRLAALSEDETLDLILCANKVRQKFKQNRVVNCSITNAKSGCCTEDCAFCAQSAHHETDIPAHALLSEERLVGDAVSLTKTEQRNFPWLPAVIC